MSLVTCGDDVPPVSHEPKGLLSMFKQLAINSNCDVRTRPDGVHTAFYCSFCDFSSLSSFLWESHISLSSHRLLLNDQRPVSLICHVCGILMLVDSTKLEYINFPSHLQMDAAMNARNVKSFIPNPGLMYVRNSLNHNIPDIAPLDLSKPDDSSNNSGILIEPKNVTNFDLSTYLLVKMKVSSCMNSVSSYAIDDHISHIMNMPVLHANSHTTQLLPPFKTLLAYNALFDFKTVLAYSCDLCKCKGPFNLELFMNHISLLHFSFEYENLNLMIFICDICRLIGLTNDRITFLYHLATPSHFTKLHEPGDADSAETMSDSSSNDSFNSKNANDSVDLLIPNKAQAKKRSLSGNESAVNENVDVTNSFISISSNTTNCLKATSPISAQSNASLNSIKKTNSSLSSLSSIGAKEVQENIFRPLAESRSPNMSDTSSKVLPVPLKPAPSAVCNNLNATESNDSKTGGSSIPKPSNNVNVLLHEYHSRILVCEGKSGQLHAPEKKALTLIRKILSKLCPPEKSISVTCELCSCVFGTYLAPNHFLGPQHFKSLLSSHCNAHIAYCALCMTFLFSYNLSYLNEHFLFCTIKRVEASRRPVNHISSKLREASNDLKCIYDIVIVNPQESTLNKAFKAFFTDIKISLARAMVSCCICNVNGCFSSVIHHFSKKIHKNTKSPASYGVVCAFCQTLLVINSTKQIQKHVSSECCHCPIEEPSNFSYKRVPVSWIFNSTNLVASGKLNNLSVSNRTSSVKVCTSTAQSKIINSSQSTLCPLALTHRRIVEFPSKSSWEAAVAYIRLMMSKATAKYCNITTTCETCSIHFDLNQMSVIKSHFTSRKHANKIPAESALMYLVFCLACESFLLSYSNDFNYHFTERVAKISASDNKQPVRKFEILTKKEFAERLPPRYNTCVKYIANLILVNPVMGSFNSNLGQLFSGRKFSSVSAVCSLCRVQGSLDKVQSHLLAHAHKHYVYLNCIIEVYAVVCTICKMVLVIVSPIDILRHIENKCDKGGPYIEISSSGTKKSSSSISEGFLEKPDLNLTVQTSSSNIHDKSGKVYTPSLKKIPSKAKDFESGTLDCVEVAGTSTLEVLPPENIANGLLPTQKNTTLTASKSKNTLKAPNVKKSKPATLSGFVAAGTSASKVHPPKNIPNGLLTAKDSSSFFYPLELSKKCCEIFRSQLKLHEWVNNILSEMHYCSTDESSFIITTLKNVILPSFPDAKLYLFGSQYAGLAKKSSDWDVFVALTESAYFGDARDVENEVTIVKELLIHSQKFICVDAILDARVPIVKAIHASSNSCYDLSFSHGTSVENTKIIKFYIEFDTRVRRLLVAVIHWAELNGIKNQGFTTFALSWMALFFLMQADNPVIPPVSLLKQLHSGDKIYICGWDVSFNDDKSTISQAYKSSTSLDSFALLKKFFIFFSNVDFRRHMLSPLTGTFFDKSLFYTNNFPDVYIGIKYNNRCYQRIYNDTAMLLDPLYLTNNILANVDQDLVDSFVLLCYKTSLLLEKIV